MTPEEAERERRTLWKAAQSAPGVYWGRLLDDLLQFAMSQPDSSVRCGRMDVVAYILDSTIAGQEE